MEIFLVVTRHTERDAAGVVLRCVAAVVYATRVRAMAEAQALRWNGTVVSVEMDHAYAGGVPLAAWVDPGAPAAGAVGV
jgi:hypothetical protein